MGSLDTAVEAIVFAQKTEDDAYKEILDNDDANPKPEDFESKSNLPHLGLTKPHTRGRLGKVKKVKRGLIKAGGAGSGWYADNGHIMHTKLGGQKGSNPGGFYKGADNVKRYVKIYSDKGQGRAEVVANNIYNDLGVSAPHSQIFGKGDFASDIIDGGETLQHAGLTKDAAREVLKGFAADVLTANWDVVGLTHDNILMKDGKAHRIDNGATFTYRAQGGTKPSSLLNKTTEYEGFFNPSINNEYAQLTKVAGYKSADEIPTIKSQVASIVSLQARYGGWDSYLKSSAPFLSDHERTQYAAMLTARTAQLAQRHPLMAAIAASIAVFSIDAGGPGSGWTTENGHVSHKSGKTETLSGPKVVGPSIASHLKAIGFDYHHTHTVTLEHKPVARDYFVDKASNTAIVIDKNGAWKTGTLLKIGSADNHKAVFTEKASGTNGSGGHLDLLNQLKSQGYDTTVPQAVNKQADKPLPSKTGNGLTKAPAGAEENIAMAKQLGFVHKDNDSTNTVSLWKHDNGMSLVTSTKADDMPWKLYHAKGALISDGNGSAKLKQIFNKQEGNKTIDTPVAPPFVGKVPAGMTKPTWVAPQGKDILDANHQYLTNKGFNYYKTSPPQNGMLMHTYKNSSDDKRYLMEDTNPTGNHDILTTPPATQTKDGKEYESNEGLPKVIKVTTDKAYYKKVADTVAEVLKATPPDYATSKNKSWGEDLSGYTGDTQREMRRAVAAKLGVPTAAMDQVDKDISNWTGSSFKSMRQEGLKVIDKAEDANPAWIIETEMTQQQLKKSYGSTLDVQRGMHVSTYGNAEFPKEMTQQLVAVKALLDSASPKWEIAFKSHGGDSWSLSGHIAKGFAGGGFIVKAPKTPVEYAVTSHMTHPNFSGGETEIVIAWPKGEIPISNKTAIAASFTGDIFIDGYIGTLRKAGWKIDVKGNKIIIYEKTEKIQAGGPGSGRHKEFGSPIQQKPKLQTKLSQKALIAKKNYVPANMKEHHMADKGEAMVKQALGGKSTGTDSEPFDVLSGDGKHAIEVKTMMKQGNDKITMHQSAIDRKNAWAAKNGASIHTIVLDVRNSKTNPDVYYRAGVGSFRLANMTKLSGMSAIKGVIK